MIEYPKIYGPFKRHVEGPNKNKFDYDNWAMPEFEALKDVPWVWTEKVDGTNIQVQWDGHRVAFGGRTENAQIPAKLINWLDVNFPEEMFEQVFGEGRAVLFGEGYGAGIQSGGNYSPDQKVVLFDVYIDGIWLRRHDVIDVASKMGVGVVNVRDVLSLTEAIDNMRYGRWPLSSLNEDQPTLVAEGVVGTPSGDFLTRRGERIMCKLKVKDFK